MTSIVVACLVGLAVVTLLAVWLVSVYNRLVRMRNQVDASGSQIDVQLKRRHDLIPNLVEAVKGYAAHERGTLEAVVIARGAAMAHSGGDAGQADAEGALSRALGRLIALGEAYPQLRANENFAALQAELATTEDKIAYSRQFVTYAVQQYNTAIESFPANLIAGVFGFHRRELFAAVGSERGPVEVSF
ncbi:LemA family protein [Dactylosporangium sp. NPDC049140]|uniref:LemA family protein n=1 Tax=Dactylosporangium sp. NPDC049140 TaxID=3155647 RepID=UPI0033D1D899